MKLRHCATACLHQWVYDWRRCHAEHEVANACQGIDDFTFPALFARRAKAYLEKHPAAGLQGVAIDIEQHFQTVHGHLFLFAVRCRLKPIS